MFVLVLRSVCYSLGGVRTHTHTYYGLPLLSFYSFFLSPDIGNQGRNNGGGALGAAGRGGGKHSSTGIS